MIEQDKCRAMEDSPLAAIQQAFADDLSYWGLTLPEEDVHLRRRGVLEDEAGIHVYYLFGQDEHGEYLDYYYCHQFGDAHERLRADGSRESLEIPAIGHLTSDDPQEAARLEQEYFASNQRIYQMLRDKGFED